MCTLWFYFLRGLKKAEPTWALGKEILAGMMEAFRRGTGETAREHIFKTESMLTHANNALRKLILGT